MFEPGGEVDFFINSYIFALEFILSQCTAAQSSNTAAAPASLHTLSTTLPYPTTFWCLLLELSGFLLSAAQFYLAFITEAIYEIFPKTFFNRRGLGSAGVGSGPRDWFLGQGT